MVERFNGRISEVVNQTRFASAAELETTLKRYVNTYNQQIPQRALNHLSPIQALKEWQKKKPELFKKRIYNQAGLDILSSNAGGKGRCAAVYRAASSDRPEGAALTAVLEGFAGKAVARATGGGTRKQPGSRESPKPRGFCFWLKFPVDRRKRDSG